MELSHVIASAAMLFVSLAALAQTNVAYQDKNVRISVVTEGVVRLEYSPTGRFVNDSSFIAVNRNYPKAQYKVKNGGTVVISTPKLVLKYKKGTGKFTDKNLSIASPKDNKAITPLSSNRDGNTLTVKIGARKGNYKDMPAQRQFTVQVVASAVPTSVTVNGQKADFTYDGNNLTVCICVPQTDCAVEKVVTLTYPQDALDVTDGLIGQFRRIQQNMLEWKDKNAGINFKDALGTMESTGLAIGYNPEQFVERIKAFRANYANLPQVLKDQGLNEDGIKRFLKATY